MSNPLADTAAKWSPDMQALIRAINHDDVEFDIGPAIYQSSDYQIRKLLAAHLDGFEWNEFQTNGLEDEDYKKVKEVIDYCDKEDESHSIEIVDKQEFFNYISSQRPYLRHPRTLIDEIVRHTSEADKDNILISLMATVFLDSDNTTGDYLVQDKHMDDDQIEQIKNTLARLVKEPRVFSDF